MKLEQVLTLLESRSGGDKAVTSALNTAIGQPSEAYGNEYVYDFDLGFPGGPAARLFINGTTAGGFTWVLNPVSRTGMGSKEASGKPKSLSGLVKAIKGLSKKYPLIKAEFNATNR